MAKREILKAIENGGTGYDFYNEGDLHIGGGGTVWIDRKSGKFYEFRSKKSDLSVDKLSDFDVNNIDEQLLDAEDMCEGIEKTLRRAERKFEVIEDNGGGLTLVIFNKNDKVEYIHSGYEYNTGSLEDDIFHLWVLRSKPAEWEGNAENPQEIYDNITSFEYGWEIVADNNGIYPDKMGAAACLEFGVERA